MLIQLFGAAFAAALYWLQWNWWVNCLLIAATVWLVMAPPRVLLAELSRLSGVFFRFPPSDADKSRVREVYLTIDDAPSPHTHLILDAIGECQRGGNKARATFFVIGESAQKNASVVRSIVEQGHAIGNHDLKDRLTASPSRSLSEIVQGLRETDAIIKSIAEVPCPLRDLDRDAPRVFPVTWFRPGCGLFTPDVLKAARELGCHTVLGDTYGHDVVFAPLPQWLAQRVLCAFYQWRVVTGSIVILHDGSLERAQNTASVIQHLFRAFPELQFRCLP